MPLIYVCVVFVLPCWQEALFALTDQFEMAVSSANSDLQSKCQKSIVVSGYCAIIIDIERELADPVLDALRPLYTIVLNSTTTFLDRMS